MGSRPPPEVGFVLIAGLAATRHRRRMIKRSLNQKCRAAALVGAAVVFSTAATVRVQAQALTNLFSGATSTDSASAAVTLVVGGTVVGGTTTGSSTTLGAGYSGSVALGNAALSSITETVNTPTTPNTFTLTTSGASLGDTFSANTTLNNVSLLPSTTYQFTATKGTASTLNLFNNLAFALTLNGTQLANTATNFGILGGTANVLGLLTNGSTASFTFTTPATIPANSALSFAISGGLGTNVNLTGAELQLTGASISQVPEPGTVAAACVGLVGLACWRSRRGVQFA